MSLYKDPSFQLTHGPYHHLRCPQIVIRNHMHVCKWHHDQNQLGLFLEIVVFSPLAQVGIRKSGLKCWFTWISKVNPLESLNPQRVPVPLTFPPNSAENSKDLPGHMCKKEHGVQLLFLSCDLSHVFLWSHFAGKTINIPTKPFTSLHLHK